MRKFLTLISITVLLTLCAGIACADIPDPDIFRRPHFPERPVESEVTASMKVEPVKEPKNTLRLTLTVTGAASYGYTVKEKDGEQRVVCSGNGESPGNGKVVEALFTHREISGDEEARYIAEAAFTPLNGNGSAQVIRQVLVVCLINGSVTVMEELDVPEIL